ncbi:unnamed protein product, partial [Linum tenue]
MSSILATHQSSPMSKHWRLLSEQTLKTANSP